MLSVKEAVKVIKNNVPNGNVESAIIYKDLYVFIVYTDDELEGQMDPFYSVDIKTGEFRDFSILTDGNIVEIMDLFTNNSIKIK